MAENNHYRCRRRVPNKTGGRSLRKQMGQYSDTDFLAESSWISLKIFRGYFLAPEHA